MKYKKEVLDQTEACNTQVKTVLKLLSAGKISAENTISVLNDVTKKLDTITRFVTLE